MLTPSRSAVERTCASVMATASVEVHAYCVMGNHYHALLRTPVANLSVAMRHLDGLLTQRLHRRRETDGPIFRGRFRSVLVQADRHLLHVTRYIHLNPVEAGLVTRPGSCRGRVIAGT